MTDPQDTAAPLTEAEQLEQQIQAAQAELARLKTKQFVREQLQRSELEHDEGLVRIVGNAMEDRLSQQRAKGLAGWHGADCSSADLQARLQKNLEEGDFLDVAILAGMLYARQHLA